MLIENRICTCMYMYFWNQPTKEVLHCYPHLALVAINIANKGMQCYLIWPGIWSNGKLFAHYYLKRQVYFTFLRREHSLATLQLGMDGRRACRYVDTSCPVRRFLPFFSAV